MNNLDPKSNNIKFFIERTDTQEWYCQFFGVRKHTFGQGWDNVRGKCRWTNDPANPMIAAFDNKVDAEDHLLLNDDIPFDVKCIVTEHEFVTAP